MSDRVGAWCKKAYLNTLQLQRSTGAAVTGLAVTDILYVSSNGTGKDGSSWLDAYKTIQAALNAASTNSNELTVIMIGPNATYYDIDITGDPSWSANVVLHGSHSDWCIIKNDHASATSILKLTGQADVNHLEFGLGTGNNGLIMTARGAAGHNIHFDGTSLTGAAKGLELVGGTNLKRARFEHITVLGHVDYMTGLKLDKCSRGRFEDIEINSCLKGIHIVNAVSDENDFLDCNIGDCNGGSGIGIDIDAGNEQHFTDMVFHHNDRNIDDEGGDHIYRGIKGDFPITVIPDDISALGTLVTTGDGADTWTASPVTVRASGDNPFRIIGMYVEAGAAERFRVRLTDGTTVFADVLIEGVVNSNNRVPINFTGDTEFIFNKGITISAASKSESVGEDACYVNLEVQEI